MELKVGTHNILLKTSLAYYLFIELKCSIRLMSRDSHADALWVCAIYVILKNTNVLFFLITGSEIFSQSEMLNSTFELAFTQLNTQISPRYPLNL